MMELEKSCPFTYDHFLMCAPVYFEVKYVINPWMDGNVQNTSAERAQNQWLELYRTVAEFAQVDLLRPQAGLPDLQFTANAGLVYEDRVILSRFLYPERRVEEERFEKWFAANGYEVLKLPSGMYFEGAGDALFDRKERLLWAGYGYRSTLESCIRLSGLLNIEVAPLRLVDERFYHLDTCFCPLNLGHLLYYPEAFDEKSRSSIVERVSADRRIPIDENDAINFACNAINIRDTVIVHHASPALTEQLTKAGYRVMRTDLSEFIKAGGAAKCLTIKLNEERAN